MMPQAIRADALFIDEELRLSHLRDFGQPRHRNSEHRRDRVADHEPGIDLVWQLGVNLKAQRRRRDLAEICRIREKAPAIRERLPHDLATAKSVDGHSSFTCGGE